MQIFCFFSYLHSIVIYSVVFCAICNLFVLVADVIGEQIVLSYSSIVLVMSMYVFSSFSLDLR